MAVSSSTAGAAGTCRACWRCMRDSVSYEKIGVHHAGGDWQCCSRARVFGASLPAHVMRAGSSLQRGIASGAERDAILQRVGAVTQTSQNLLAFRRSALFVLLLVALSASILTTMSAVDSRRSVLELEATAAESTVMDAVREGFAGYTKRMLEVGVARMLLPARMVNVWLDVAVAALAWLAFLCNVAALASWLNYSTSRRLVLFGWLLTFVAPFAVSVVPVRDFVNWNGMSDVQSDYLATFKMHFNLNEVEIVAISTCEGIMGIDEHVETVESMLIGVCDSLENNVPDRSFDVSLIFAEFKMDGRPVHEKCHDTRQYIQAGSYAEAVDSAQAACQSFLELVENGPGGNSNAMIASVGELVDQAKNGAEVVIALLHAVMSFKIMAPAALSLAPGIIRGALKVKTMVPQSSLPGMFIMVLPWLYCPLVWAIYNLVFQLVGNNFLLAALLLLAYSPMAYFFIGGAFQVTRPMDDVAVGSVAKWIGRYTGLCVLIAYALVGYFMYSNTVDSFIVSHLVSMFSVRACIAIVVNVLAKYYYTTLAGVDYMIGEIAGQRQFEVFLESGHSVRAQVAIANARRGPGRRDSIRTLMADRNTRLDDLCVLLHRNATGVVRKAQSGAPSAKTTVSIAADGHVGVDVANPVSGGPGAAGFVASSKGGSGNVTRLAQSYNQV